MFPWIVNICGFFRCDKVCKKPCFHEILTCIQTTMTWITSVKSQNFYSFLNETSNPLKYKLFTKEVNSHHTVCIKKKKFIYIYLYKYKFPIVFNFDHTYILHTPYNWVSYSREGILETKPVLGMGEIFPQLDLKIELYILGRFIILSRHIAHI